MGLKKKILELEREDQGLFGVKKEDFGVGEGRLRFIRVKKKDFRIDKGELRFICRK